MTRQPTRSPADEAAFQLLRWKDDFPTYAREVLKIRTKEGGLVPFELNRAQQRVWEFIKEDLDTGRPVRIYLLKARQLGMSTLTEGLGYWYLTLHTHRDGLIVAHDTDAAARIFSMMQLMWQESPVAVRPLRRISNRREMWWANANYPQDGSENPGLQSRVLIATADNKNFGVSGTIQFAHLSEFARYPEVNSHIAETMKTFRQAVPRKPWTFVIYETTAKGFNMGKEVWDDPLNGIRKLFLSWVADEDYTVEEPLDEADLEARPEGRYGDEKQIREHILRELKVWYPAEAHDQQWLFTESLKRLAWRRIQIDQEFDGDKAVFRQEHPITAQEAFITSGTSIFDTPKLTDLRDQLEVSPLPVSAYAFNKRLRNFELSESRTRMFLSENVTTRSRAYTAARGAGDLRVYEMPRPGIRYAIGADVSEGYSDSDYSAAQVLRLPDMVQVSVAQLHIDPDDFADYLASLGKIYNKAWIAVEVTGSGLSTQLRLNKHLHYPFLYRRQVFDQSTNRMMHKYGWSTNRASKPIMTNDLKGVLRDDLLIVQDIPTVEELSAYVQLDDSGKTGAASGHDDLVTSLAIAWQMVVQMGGVPRISDNQSITQEPKVVTGSALWWEKVIDDYNDDNNKHVLGRSNYGNTGW
jgi:hypothetical protein